jgi:hypothetical protein
LTACPHAQLGEQPLQYGFDAGFRNTQLDSDPLAGQSVKQSLKHFLLTIAKFSGIYVVPRIAFGDHLNYPPIDADFSRGIAVVRAGEEV